jgi:hypothetical protein
MHRDPLQPVYRMRKIQCISQRRWNGLRVKNFTPESDKSGQRGLTPGDTKAC